MKLRIVLIAFFTLFLIGCQPKEEVDVFSKDLIFYSEDDIQDSITQNFTLVLKVEDTQIDWSSSDTSVILIVKEKAIVFRQAKDSFITITASYGPEDNLQSKKFILVVKGKDITKPVDLVPPVITGKTNIEVLLGTTIDPLTYVEAMDDIDGEVAVKIKSSDLDINKVGTYTIVFEASDLAANSASFTLIIKVVDNITGDLIPPVITGISNIEISLGSQIDPLSFVEAVDDIDGEVAVKIKSSDLDADKVGTYTIVFEASDSAGNTSTFTLSIKVGNIVEKITYTEDFSKLQLPGSTYTAGSFVGNHSIIWNYSGSRGDQIVDEDAITFGGKTTDYSSLKTTLSDGISYFSVDLKKAFTQDNLRKIALIINDDIVEEFVLDNNNLNIQKFIVDLVVYGDYTLEIAQVDTSDNRAQISLDNIVIINNPRSSLSLEEQNLNKDFEELLVQNAFIEVGNISLPTTGDFGSEITWRYTDQTNQTNNLINLTTGQVTLPSSGIVDVKIDAVLVNGAYQLTKTFTIKIGEGDPLPISEVYKAVEGQKVKIKGVVSNIFETTDGKKFFIQDDSKGILVYLSTTEPIEIGDEIVLIAEKQKEDGLVYLNNISKLEILSSKVFFVPALTNQNLETLEGKLVNLTGLLKFTYGNVNDFTLVNEFLEFDIHFIDNLINNSSLKSKIAGQFTGLEVDVFGVVYLHDGNYKIYVTTPSDLEVASSLDLNKIDEVIHSHLDFPTNNMSLSRNLQLITEADLFIDLKIEWTSSNPDVLSHQGVIYQTAEDANVVLTYKIYIDDSLISTNSLNLIVQAKSAYTGYYASIQGLTGASLKSELNSIISRMKTIAYKDTSYVLEDADIDLTKTGQLLLIYSRTNAKNKWDGASTWNKEHIWPQSKLGSASKSDIHNLRASNVSVNSSRGNLAYVNGSGSYQRINGGWYPGDQDKGDVARIVLYMNLRWGLDIKSSVIGELSMFISWHQADPVDDFEIHRNQVIFENQENRNPFIDHPELVEMIYGSPSTLSLNLEEPIEEYYIQFLSVHNVDLLNRRLILF